MSYICLHHSVTTKEFQASSLLASMLNHISFIPYLFLQNLNCVSVNLVCIVFMHVSKCSYFDEFHQYSSLLFGETWVQKIKSKSQFGHSARRRAEMQMMYIWI